MTERPYFMKKPYDTLRYYARTRPQYFWPLTLSLTMIPGIIALTSFRRKYLYADHTPIPVSYPRMLFVFFPGHLTIIIFKVVPSINMRS
ncbi:uncharacterized protein V1513DRAFT_443573 [Lipomyces chichibuensis]|uniref:uncharacterized protein n=1 Tax=Lipomyces chichibuensis TaxID=1546026 RepID=UPI0033436432